MISIKNMPTVTVEEINRFRSAAKQIEAQRDQLMDALTNAVAGMQLAYNAATKMCNDETLMHLGYNEAAATKVLTQLKEQSIMNSLSAFNKEAT